MVLVTETFPPDVNGVAMTLERLVAGLSGRGHEVTIVRPIPRRSVRRRERSKPANDLRLTGFPIPKYPDLQFGRPAWLTLRRRWKQDRPDLVHIATEGPLGLTALWAARGLGLPVTSSFHTNFHQYGKHYGYAVLKKTLEAYGRYFHNRTAVTFAPSDGICEMLGEMGIAPVALLGRGVDTELYGPHRRSDDLRRQWGVGPDDPVVGYVGRVASEKNLPVTLQAFRAFQERQPTAKLVVVGDGPERPRLETEHPDLIFAGMRHDEDLAAYYASCDLFFFASETETFGNVVTEAMASGLVVLTYGYAAGQKHIIDGQNGRLAPFGDADAYLTAARELAAQWPACRQMGAAAREKAATISWGRIVDDFEGRLKSVIDTAVGSAQG
ncbi:MAG: glycosyltransferase family 4 protein [Opitutales bacterium]